MKYNSDKYNVRLHTNNVYLQTNKQYSEELLSSFYDSEKHFQIKKKKKKSLPAESFEEKETKY